MSVLLSLGTIIGLLIDLASMASYNDLPPEVSFAALALAALFSVAYVGELTAEKNI
jgi:hypothetical protein